MKTHSIRLFAMACLLLGWLSNCERGQILLDALPAPCEGITCLNGGQCLDGGCDCPENTKGASCEIQIPQGFQLTSVTLELPFYCEQRKQWIEAVLLDESSGRRMSAHRVEAKAGEMNLVPFDKKLEAGKNYTIAFHNLCEEPELSVLEKELITNLHLKPIRFYQDDNAPDIEVTYNQGTLILQGTWIY